MAQEGDEEGTLPLLTAGARLREARLAAGLELEEVAARTRVSKRHLAAIEDDRYSELASRTYAVGFSKAFARAVGLDEESIAQGVRDELSRQEDLNPRVQRSDRFEPGDPARLPSSSLAWMAAGGAILLFALIFVFWRSFLDPAGSMPDLIEDRPSRSATHQAAAAKQVVNAPVAAMAAVRLTALEDGVWVRIDDASGEQVFQKELALNESYLVPANAAGPVLSTARPDMLRVTVGSRTLARLRPAPEVLRNIPLTPASLLTPSTPTATTAKPAGVIGRPAGETSTVSER